LEGLGATGDEAALSLVRAELRPDASFQVRRAAVGAMARLAEGTLEARRTRELVETALDERDFRVRIEAGPALTLLGARRARAAGTQATAGAAPEVTGRTGDRGPETGNRRREMVGPPLPGFPRPVSGPR